MEKSHEGILDPQRGVISRTYEFVQREANLDIIDHAGYVLFKQVHAQRFHELLVRWPKLSSMMEELGGSTVFGSWISWTCPFQLLNDHEKWDGAAFEEGRRAVLIYKQTGDDQSGLGRVAICRYHESVHWTTLRTYATSGNDRRQNILDTSIQKHVDPGHNDTEYPCTTDFLTTDVLLYAGIWLTLRRDRCTLLPSSSSSP